MKKRIWSLLLALMMMLSLVPSMAWGATRLGYTPYPEVQYSYTNSTSAGMIRYIAQNSGSEYFSWNYWPTSSFGGYSSPSTECGTACISMALSYVGVNRTPKELLESTNGYTGSMWGTQGNATSRAITISEAGISSAMNNYINGNGKYSPLCVYIQPFSATSSMHWVLLVGKISENTYLALNPWHSSGTNGTFTLQVNGSKATYNGTTNPITSVNQWYNASAEIAPHTCDRGSYQYYEAVHPHYKCYKCSICGKIWRDTSAPTKLADCEQCYPRTTTITYYGSDGSVWATAGGTADKSYTLRTDYPRRDGSYFAGWSYTAGADSFDLRPGDTVTMKGSMDLYPVYVTHEQAISGDEVYIFDINDFDSDGYDVESAERTVQTRLDNSGWGNWSDYSLSSATESATRQVRTTTMYRYYYFQCPSCGAHEPFTGKSDCGATITGSGWHEKWFTTPYASSNYKKFSYTTSKYYTTSLGDGQIWIFSAGNLNNTTPGTKDATGSGTVISTGYSTRQWNSQYKTVDYSATAYRITKKAEPLNYCGNDLTWTLNDQGVLTISGTGDMWDYNPQCVPWYDRREEIRAVSLTDGLTGIGNYMFEGCSKLESVVIPEGATDIGNYAFFGCEGLTSVAIPAGIKTIGNGAFTGCKELTSMVIPNTVTNIGYNSFSECSNLTEITVAAGNRNYTSEDGMLLNKSGTDLIACPGGKTGSCRVPDGVINIKNSAFYGCEKLTDVTIPFGVTNIEENAFAGCLLLDDVYFDGTESQWNQIVIANGNDPLLNATIHFADPEPQPPAEVSATIAISNGQVRPGGKVTVKVSVTENQGISNMRIQLSYPAGFTLESIQREDGLPSLTFTPPGKLTANPINLVWDGLDADTAVGTLLTLTFSVAETVQEGDYAIRLSYQKGDVLDGDLEDIDLALQNGNVSVVSFTYGDVNGDGEVNMKDLGMLRRYFAGGYGMEDFVMEAADVNGDGEINMKDLGVLRRYFAGGYDIKLGK